MGSRDGTGGVSVDHRSRPGKPAFYQQAPTERALPPRDSRPTSPLRGPGRARPRSSILTPWLVIAWIGNGFYFSRFLLQWISSERSGESVTPRAFWWLSLGGCVCLGSYVAHRNEALLLPAYLVNGAIYVRILWIAATGERRARLGPLPAAAIGLAAALTMLALGVAAPGEGSRREELGWVLVALAGQTVWSTRFLLQWWHSERSGRSDFPNAFWWYSLAGSGFNLAFTLHLGDAPLIASFALTPLYPIRNLMLARRARRR